MTMRKPLEALVLVALTFLFLLGMGPGRCAPVPSVNPIYTEKDIVFEPSLVGTWAANDSLIRVTAAENKAYEIEIIDFWRGQGIFTAHLAKIRGQLYLDIYPDPEEADIKWAWYEDNFVPVHTMALVEQLGPNPVIAFFDADWLTEYLSKHPRAIKHSGTTRDDIILTAPTKKLQRLLRKASTREDAFGTKDLTWKLVATKYAALHLAAVFGDTNEIDQLLAEGVDINVSDDSDGWTALHRAILVGKVQMAEHLIVKGANVNAESKDEFTPLHFASATGHARLAHVLIRHGADINAKAEDGETAVDMAVSEGHIGLVELLFANGATNNPLHTAVVADDTIITDYLILRGTDVNTKNKDGDTPLHTAVRRNNKAMIKLLISKGAEVNVKNAKGETPLALATNRDMVKLLKRHGAKE